MALTDILEAIRADCQETTSKIISEAQAEVEAILQDARDEASAEEERLAASLDDEARIEQRRIMSRAHLEASRERRAVREEVYRSAVEAVRQSLERVRRSPDYTSVLASLIDEAMAVLPEATTILADPIDLNIVKDLVGERNLNVRVEAGECPMGGVIVVADGRSVDNTLQSRLQRADQHLRFVAGALIPALREQVG